MVVAPRHEPRIATVLPVGVVVRVPGEEETAEQGELGRIYAFFINDRLACFEEVVIVWAEHVFV